jgi:hypothetical protein
VRILLDENLPKKLVGAMTAANTVLNSLSFNSRDFRTIHGSRPACGWSRLTSPLRNKKAPGLRRGLSFLYRKIQFIG